MNIGRVRREFETNAKNQQNKDKQNSIVESFLANMEQIGQLGPNFANALSENRPTIAGLFDKVEDLQEEAIQPLAANEFNRDLDNMVDSLKK